MRKCSFFLVFAFLISMLSGCKAEETFVSPITFYYPTSDIQYEPDSLTIQPETREGCALLTFPAQMQAFLEGPIHAEYIQPFPDGLSLINALLEESRIYLTFSQELSTLNGLKLTIACCCIAKTTMELSSATEVHISVSAGLLNGEKTLIFTQENMLFLDEMTDFDEE